MTDELEQAAAAELEALFAELDGYLDNAVEHILPTDLTYPMLQKRYGLKSSNTVKTKMIPLVEQGKYEYLKVYDPAVGRLVHVYRKVL